MTLHRLTLYLGALLCLKRAIKACNYVVKLLIRTARQIDRRLMLCEYSLRRA